MAPSSDRNADDRAHQADPHAARPPSHAISVVVVDDHTLFARSILLILHEAGIHASALPVRDVDTLWTGSVAKSTGHEAPGRGSGPGLVLLDLDLGIDPETNNRMSGADLISDLRGGGWQVLVLTGSEDQAHIAAAITAGALGVVAKTDDFDQLLDAVKAASTGRSLISKEERAHWEALDAHYHATQRERDARLSKLSPREREVLELIAEGYRAAAIASHFVVSISTVRAQIRAILAKTKSSSQLEAAALLRDSLDQ